MAAERKGAGIWRYLREAFTFKWNLLLFGGAVAAGVLSGHADVVLPASSFAEKDGTFTNTERRINRVRAAVPLPGNARGDREIVIALARALGCDWPEYPDAASVWDELADLCPNWYGVRYPRLEEHGLQWPCPTEDHPGTMFLHEGHPSLPSGKGKFHPVEYQPPIEEPDIELPGDAEWLVGWTPSTGWVSVAIVTPDRPVPTPSKKK